MKLLILRQSSPACILNTKKPVLSGDIYKAHILKLLCMG
jgi:hypothetical protein